MHAGLVDGYYYAVEDAVGIVYGAVVGIVEETVVL